jgi:hypothetical protein
MATHHVCFGIHLHLYIYMYVCMHTYLCRAASLRKLARAAVSMYPEEPRDEWVLHQPAQLVIVVSQIFWCQVRAGDDSFS